MDNDNAVDLSDEIKARSAGGAAAKLATFPAAELANKLMRLSPGFAQDVIDALPNDARERAISAAPAEVARQWQRNSMYDAGSRRPPDGAGGRRLRRRSARSARPSRSCASW